VRQPVLSVAIAVGPGKGKDQNSMVHSTEHSTGWLQWLGSALL